MRRLAYLAAVAATAVAIGCGGDDDDASNNADDYDGTDAEVAALVDDLANAARDGDRAKICEELFTPEFTANIEREAGQSCESEVEDNFTEGEYELQIDSLDVDGDTAIVDVTDQNGNSSTLQVENVDGAWRIAQVPGGE